MAADVAPTADRVPQGGPRGWGRALVSVAIAAGLVGVLCSLTYRLAEFPGLHGDEAWLGVRALEHRDRGLFTLIGSTWYSGALHPYAVSLVIRSIGVSVLSLRIISVAANALAFALLLAHLRRRAGWSGVLLFVMLLAGSVLLLFKARLAWEVTAYGALTCAVLVLVARALLDRAAASIPLLLVYFVVSLLACANHLLLACVVAAFLAASVLLASWSGGKPEVRFLVVNLVNAGTLLVLFLCKRAVASEAAFAHHRETVFLALAVAPLLELLLFRLLDQGIGASAWFSRGSAESRRRIVARLRWGVALPAALAIVVGLTAFAACHGDGFIGALSNVKVLMRLFSWRPPAAIALVDWLFAAGILGLYALVALRTLRSYCRGAAASSDALLMLLPLSYAGAALPLATQFSSLRYYAPAIVLLFVALAACTPAALSNKARAALLIAVFAFATLAQVQVWASFGGAAVRSPLRFALGSATETSVHFLPTRDLYERMKTLGICRFAIDTPESWFIVYPLYFYRAADGYACDSKQTAWFSYCDDCTDPRGFEVRFRSR